jgi:hypothetical protein
MTDSLSLSISLLSRQPHPLLTPITCQRPGRSLAADGQPLDDDKPFGGKNGGGGLLRAVDNEDPRFSPANKMETFLPQQAMSQSTDASAAVPEVEKPDTGQKEEASERPTNKSPLTPAAGTAFVRVTPGSSAALATARRAGATAALVTKAAGSTKPKIAPKPNLGPQHSILGSRVLPPLATNTRYRHLQYSYGSNYSTMGITSNFFLDCISVMITFHLIHHNWITNNLACLFLQ